MCRIFAFRSIFSNKVHKSLIHADNALGTLSNKHSDGWGVAFYVDEVPHLIRSTNKAIDDHIFHKVSGVVSSQNVVAHIRNATQGNNTILNSHPFQFGKWIFAHNGNIKSLEKHKSKLFSLISEQKKKYILGGTDSEIIFHIILTELNKRNLLYGNPQEDINAYNKCIKEALTKITKIIGDLTNRDDAKPKENYLTFVLTNGSFFFALQGGQPLYYSTHKESCSEKNICQFYDKSCENKSNSKSKINHLLISSEPLDGENIWSKLEFGDLISLDDKLIFNKEKITLPLAIH